MKVKKFTALIISTVIFTACAGIKLQDYPAESCAKLPGEKTMSVVKDRCGLCHKGDFATRELTCSRKALIIDSVTSKRMPKFGNLNEEALNTILKWEL